MDKTFVVKANRSQVEMLQEALQAWQLNVVAKGERGQYSVDNELKLIQGLQDQLTAITKKKSF